MVNIQTNVSVLCYLRSWFSLLIAQFQCGLSNEELTSEPSLM